MADSDAKSFDEQPELDSLDETIPMQTLEHLLQSSEPGPDDDKPGLQSSEPHTLQALLQRLIEVAESMDRRLDQIATIPKNQGARKRTTATRKKVVKKRAAQADR